jgi:hypothetical protein
MGFTPSIVVTEQKVIEAIEHVRSVTKQKNEFVGIHCSSGAAVSEMLSRGFDRARISTDIRNFRSRRPTRGRGRLRTRKMRFMLPRLLRASQKVTSESRSPSSIVFTRPLGQGDSVPEWRIRCNLVILF